MHCKKDVTLSLTQTQWGEKISINLTKYSQCSIWEFFLCVSNDDGKR